MKVENKPSKEEIGKIAARIERYADRFENANHTKEILYTREVVNSIRKCSTLENALDIEKGFISNIKKKHLSSSKIGCNDKMDGY